MKKECPNKPFCLFGHSMGSFLSWHYSRHYANELSRLVSSGTGGDPGFVSLANESGCMINYKQDSERRDAFGITGMKPSAFGGIV